MVRSLITMSKFPSLYEELLNDDNAEKIEYNISVNYVNKLTVVFGLKEFITNFLDVNNLDFFIDFDGKKLVLKDENTGIPIKYMVIGNSGSREVENRRGKFGEGFKVGALTLARLGFRVLIDTVDYSIAFNIEKSEHSNSDVLYAKYRLKNDNEKTPGTRLYAECKKTHYDKAKAMFLFLSEHTKITDNIIDMEGTQKNIYIQGLSHTAKKAIFAYDVYDKDLSTNRDRDFIPLNLLKDQLVNIYNDIEDADVAKIIMDKFLEHTHEFDKMLESKIVFELEFDDYQKKIFRQSLNSKDYYCLKGSNVSLNDDSKKIIEVDDKLFHFLSYIKANVIHENGDFADEKEGTMASFKFDKEALPSSFEVESSFLRLLSNQVAVKEDSLVFTSPQDKYSNFFPNTEFDTYITQFKNSNKAYNQRNYEDPFKPIFNDLLLLACYDFDVTISQGGFLYRLDKEIVNNKITIFIKKDKGTTNQKCCTVKKMILFDNGIKEEKKSYIYVGCLRYEKINSFYSYQVTKFSRYGLYNLDSNVSDIIDNLLKENPKIFLEKYIARIEDNLYEHKMSIVLTNKTKQVFKQIFESTYPNYVIKSNNATYDTVVSENYGYKLLTLPNYRTEAIFVEQVGIKKASDVFIEKQKEEIHVIPSTDALKEAIILFEKTTRSKVEVLLTPVLPNNQESINKNGKIYISDAGSKIPFYLAGLMAYEHAQMANRLKKVSHEMQSHLTHYVLN